MSKWIHTKSGMYTVGNTYVLTRLPNGDVVRAHTNYDEESVARARSLGYNGDVEAMTREHDPLHTRVASALGFKESYSLRAAFNGEDSEIAGAEEEVVLAAQRLLNLHRRLNHK